MKKYPGKTAHPDASEMNHAAYKLGCALYCNGDLRKAIRAFEEALRYWPKDAQAWMALGCCYDETRKPKLAEQHFRRALGYCEEKHKDKIRCNLGNSLFDQGKLKAAIALYESISNFCAIMRSFTAPLGFSLNIHSLFS